MSSRILDFEESRKKPGASGRRLQEMQRRIRLQEVHIESLESLLDRIVICCNAYRDGDVSWTADSLLEAVVQEINCTRLLTTNSAVS
jgi:hypothetical protein